MNISGVQLGLRWGIKATETWLHVSKADILWSPSLFSKHLCHCFKSVKSGRSKLYMPQNGNNQIIYMSSNALCSPRLCRLVISVRRILQIYVFYACYILFYLCLSRTILSLQRTSKQGEIHGEGWRQKARKREYIWCYVLQIKNMAVTWSKAFDNPWTTLLL